MSDASTSRTSPTLLDWLLPSDAAARKITLWMLAPVALVYTGRILAHLWLDYNRGPWGLLGLFLAAIACAIVAILALVILGLAAFAVRRARHFAPALLLLGGFAAVPFLPLPPLPRPIFPEEEFFIAHREDFEYIVLLAENDELSCIWRGCEYIARVLPPGYTHLSYDGDVSVYHARSGGLVVEFRPTGFYYPVIYFERPRDVTSHYQCEGLRWVQHLDEHWHICVEDWN